MCMKKPTQKFIIVQILIVVIIFLPMIFSLSTDWYLGEHLIPSHDRHLGDFHYDNSVATWLDKFINFHFPPDSFMRDVEFLWNDFWDVIYDTPFNISEFILQKRNGMTEVLGFLLIIPFWLTIINSVYFLLKKTKKVSFAKGS